MGTKSSKSRGPEVKLLHKEARSWRQVDSLLRPIATHRDCGWERVIEALGEICKLTENCPPQQRPDFPNLYAFIKEGGIHFGPFYRDIALWALDAPTLFQEGSIATLVKGEDGTVTLSSEQVRCLLALMFWCAVPKVKGTRLPVDNTLYRVFTVPGDVQKAKIFCFASYFQSVRSDRGTPDLIFHRLSSTRSFPSNPSPLLPVQLVGSPQALIEEQLPSLKVDFANCFFGGGVVTHGSAQEECMLLAYMEPIVGLLFIEELGPTDVLYLKNVRLFNKYAGYLKTFKWAAPVQNPATDGSVVVAMDAGDYRKRVDDQYTERAIERDLSKAYAGFYASSHHPEVKVTTGNWGCGVYKGDVQLKFMIQWIAASLAHREIIYLSQNRPELADAQNVLNALVSQNAHDVLKLLHRYTAQRHSLQLFPFLIQEVTGVPASQQSRQPPYQANPAAQRQLNVSQSQVYQLSPQGESYYQGDAPGFHPLVPPNQYQAPQNFAPYPQPQNPQYGFQQPARASMPASSMPYPQPGPSSGQFPPMPYPQPVRSSGQFPANSMPYPQPVRSSGQFPVNSMPYPQQAPSSGQFPMAGMPFPSPMQFPSPVSNAMQYAMQAANRVQYPPGAFPRNMQGQGPPFQQ